MNAEALLIERDDSMNFEMSFIVYFFKKCIILEITFIEFSDHQSFLMA